MSNPFNGRTLFNARSPSTNIDSRDRFPFISILNNFRRKLLSLLGVG